MSEPITSAPATVGPGEIQFFDRIAPPFKAGPHRLSISQSVEGIVGETPEPFTAEQPFNVTAPQFRIDPSTIQQVFPPSNHEGHYSGVLPSIVFKEFSLPWMRTPDPKGNTADPRPWMVLLTISEDEMPAPPGKDGPPSPKLTFPATMSVADFLTPSDTVLVPDLGDVTDADGQDVLAAEIEVGFFQGIAPSGEDLGFLAHARVVNTDGKVVLGMDEDGAFSVVTGNRTAIEGGTNTALLISVEGHLAHLPGSGTPVPSQYTSVRVAVLGSWQFHANASPGGFVQLLEQMCQTGRGGVDLLRLHPALDDPTPNDWAKEALAIGYVPLQNDLRDGEVSTSLYRGPLVPQPTQIINDYGPFYFSDHAIHYDPDYGVFNHAYACAWQVGRLLALSDAAFVRQLIDWRRAYASYVADHALKTQAILPMANVLSGQASGASNLPDAVQALFSDRLAALADNLPTIGTRTARAAPGNMPAPKVAAQSDAQDTSLGDPLHDLRRQLWIGDEE